MRKRRLFLVAAALLAFLLLFTLLLPVLEAGHDCCGEHCAVCEQIRACIRLLRDLLPALALIQSAALLPVLIKSRWEGLPFPRRKTTLIALKVKLSD